MEPRSRRTAGRLSAPSGPLHPRRRGRGACPRWARSLPTALSLLGLLALAGCGTVDAVGDFFLGGGSDANGPAHLQGFIGGVAADEPRAALAAREVLAAGGNAADAATALGLTLAVTLPSRAALGAGGACLAYQPAADSPAGGAPEAVMFTPVAPATPGSNADRPAAVPMLARGLYLLQARYGSLPFEQLVGGAERLARLGVPVSRALAEDLAQVSAPLLADPAAAAVFATPAGAPLGEGMRLVQRDLAATLAGIRVSGVGDFYQGIAARRLVAAADAAGGGLDLGDLRRAVPRLATPLDQPAGNDRVAFLPPPADGGLAAAAAFSILAQDPGALALAGARAEAVAALWRTQGGDPATLLGTSPPPGHLPPLPASTSFVVLDRHGGSVACAITMDNLFGIGRIAPGTGVLLAASPASKPVPLLAAALAWNANLHAFRAAVAGSGQNGAALAVAAVMAEALRGGGPMPQPPPPPGRANALACSRYLPGEPASCAWATDPRGFGLAVGSD